MHAIAELIREHRAEQGLLQTEVAAWFQRWRIERNVFDELRRWQKTDPEIVEEIRQYVTTNNRYHPDEMGSQGSISKWERGNAPAPDKWLPLAEWLGLSLREVRLACTTEAEPSTGEGRLLALRKMRANYDAAAAERDELADMLREQRQSTMSAMAAYRVASGERDAVVGQLEEARATITALREELTEARATNAAQTELISELAGSSTARAKETERLATVVSMAQREMSVLRERVATLSGMDIHPVPAG